VGVCVIVLVGVFVGVIDGVGVGVGQYSPQVVNDNIKLKPGPNASGLIDVPNNEQMFELKV
jgi:hypothetical protein